jgi:hypothetical protein
MTSVRRENVAGAGPAAMARLRWRGSPGCSQACDSRLAQIVRHIATACQVVWAVGLVGLVIVRQPVVLVSGRRTRRNKLNWKVGLFCDW